MAQNSHPEGQSLSALDALPGGGATVRSLLERSYLLFQPSLAGMGVGAWDLAVESPELARPEAAARRMLSGSDALSAFLGTAVPEGGAPVDPQAAERIADLETAVAQLAAAQEALPGEADDAREDLELLRRQVARRLAEERAHHPQPVDGPQAGDSPEEGPKPIFARRSPRSVYEEALDTPVAVESAEPPSGLEALRAQIGEAANAALAADAGDPATGRLLERARRLLAQEVALTGGQPQAHRVGLDTAAVRRALLTRQAADRPNAAEGQTLRPGLTEVPIRASADVDAEIVGYLAAGEVIAAQGGGDGHTQVTPPGLAAPGWIEDRWLEQVKAASAARGPLPGTKMTAIGDQKGNPPTAELARFARLVSEQSGQPLAELLAQLKSPEDLEKTLAKAPRKDRGAAAASPREVSRGIRIHKVDVAGLKGPDAARQAAVLNGALSRLPRLLGAKLARDPDLRARLSGTGAVNAAVPTRTDGNLESRADEVAEVLAERLLAAGRADVSELRVSAVGAVSAPQADPQSLLAGLANEDAVGIASALSAERKTLDATSQARLASFFGRAFNEVMIFAGPMAGALARSLNAEAITHGKMVFFDPAHYRPDTARGEALMAHELAHTLQTDDRDSRFKEAEALAAEAGYLDWIQPGGAPLAQDSLLEPTAPSAAAAGDMAGGIHRAEKGRKLAASEGPRDDVATQERRVAQVLEKVRELLGESADVDDQLVGHLGRIFVGPI